MLYLCKKGKDMNVLMNEDLYELYVSGRSRKYKEVERNHLLMESFVRAVRIDSYTGLYLWKRLMDWKLNS